MNIVLDHCIDRNFAKLIPSEHRVRTARQARLDRLKNGTLLRAAAEDGFDVLVTTDKNIRHQQDLDEMPISVLELNTRFTKFVDLAVLEPYLPAALDATRSHRFVSIDADGHLDTLSPR